ncbi:carbohydrate esterase family 9 protein [Sphaerobolus stellatus SS14]|uniref:Unplaced genomic scaffold SPHSTscaffold_142, whole genome shotgun sequence n=1 Tax=Sphaerobolus stellatus (strain SS14) TaxID=990650 RepID=A0A0C9V6X0_SPHS4|nr:carbohydrate esterase family 9 protein [Sphaerobolus stellatus SS14]
MPTANSLVCFTNCKLALEDGSIVQRDLWIDEEKGIIVDAQKTFFEDGRRPDTIIDVGGSIISPGLIDVQINGAYGFDFSLFPNEDAKAYDDGLRMIAERIVETGVTSLLPTIITQQKELYSKLLPLLGPAMHPNSATLLGWHAEGPFLQPEKRGAHLPGFLLKAPKGVATFEEVYGAEALSKPSVQLAKRGNITFPGVRLITAAPEIEGVLPAMEELVKRGVVYSIGHSSASSEIARKGVLAGARLITHLFNAMPQLHHRDPSIIGLLGAPPLIVADDVPLFSNDPAAIIEQFDGADPTLHGAEALSEAPSPSQSPPLSPTRPEDKPISSISARIGKRERTLDGQGVAKKLAPKKSYAKPFYGIIVDGCHSHPHSVRLAYTAHPEGCILITDAMPMLDPHLTDGLHEWRDGRRVVKEGVKLYIEGTNTLAGSVVTLDTCVRNFVQFTGCTLGQALKCATYNPAACLGIENHKGTLRPGADADLVLLDAAGNVKGTWVAGKKVWPVEK